MKAITLWQPWASLMAQGFKQIETRSWETSYRGPLAIHAAKRFDKEQRKFAKTVKDDFGIELGMLPMGKVLAVVWLEEIYPADSYVYEDFDRFGAFESDFGDFSDGRFGWETSLCVRQFPEPVAVRGWQGLWNWDAPRWYEDTIKSRYKEGRMRWQ